jgi:hypothetical protein
LEGNNGKKLLNAPVYGHMYNFKSIQKEKISLKSLRALIAQVKRDKWIKNNKFDS